MDEEVNTIQNLGKILAIKTSFIKKYQECKGFMTEFINFDEVLKKSKIEFINKENKNIIKTTFENFEKTYLILTGSKNFKNIIKDPDINYKYPINIVYNNESADPNSFSIDMLVSSIESLILFPFRTFNENETRILERENLHCAIEKINNSIYYKIMFHEEFKRRNLVVKKPCLAEVNFEFVYLKFSN